MAAANLLNDTLSLITYVYTTFVSPQLPPTLDNTVRYTSSVATSTITTLILPILASGDIVSIAALLLTLYFSLKTLNYLRRSLFGWIFFFVKLGLLLVLVQAVVYVNAYGWEKAVKDAGWLGGMAWGAAEGVWDGAAGRGHGNNRYGGGSGWGSNNSGRQQYMGGGVGGARNRWR
ncbi:uncharacterized protein AB675_4107 [Cyphellophora attinorum]|uniref:Uncharacterized protein n=1 Tax=Cyphellophora attinorum TaxID=1664694 RepID=A0A0N1H935_9EURO|nr:uncharacterized protein AB675_4107 [Phialophora attinorum]KPI38590.1 hypothetical protein AB675_4107 [Phialophora attinorum]